MGMKTQRRWRSIYFLKIKLLNMYGRYWKGKKHRNSGVESVLDKKIFVKK
jgi:hypothetical protein